MKYESSEPRRVSARFETSRSALIALALALCVISVPASAAGLRILVFGDSLSAAHGIPQDAGWVALLKKRLAKDHDNATASATVINASVSGETTAGGLSRLPAALARARPDIMILELGANDGLRALPVSAMRHNLTRMIELARSQGARVLLLGMRIPPNYGPAYTKQFHAAFDQLAQHLNLAYDPFFLAPIATDRSQFQADGLHPIAAAEPRLLDRIWKTLAPMLKTASSRQPRD